MASGEASGEDSSKVPEGPPKHPADPEATGEGGPELGGEDEVTVDLATALGATQELSPQVLRLYIPNKDRQNREFGCQRRWVIEAAELLTEIGGGVTILPPAEGGWYDEDHRVTIWENPILVYTYVKPDLFQKTLPRLRGFLPRLGRETDQGEIVFEFDGDFYRIRAYDPPGGG